MPWKEIKLGDLLEQYRIEHIVQDNKDYGQITISKNGYVKYRTTKNGKSIGRKRQFIIDLDTYPNTLLFTRQGVAEGAIGFAPDEVNGCIATENMPMFSLKDNISKEFVILLLKSQQYINEVKKLIPTGSAQKSIHERDLLQIPLKIPDSDEQKLLSKKIDNRLQKVNILSFEISNQEELLKKLRQSILQDAIEGKLTASWREQNPDVENASTLLEKIKAEKVQLIKEKKSKKQKALPPISDDEIPFEIPDSWEWCRLGEIIFDTEGGKSPSCKNEGVEGEEWGVIKTTAIQKMYFSEEENKVLPANFKVLDHHIVHQNDLLITRAGPINRVGIVCEVKNLTKNIILSDKTIRINHNKTFLSPSYLELILNSPIIKKTMEKYMTGMADSQVNISQDNMKKLLVVLIPEKEQNEIVNKVENIFSMCDQLEEQINNSKTNTETLMQAVLKEAFEK